MKKFSTKQKVAILFILAELFLAFTVYSNKKINNYSEKLICSDINLLENFNVGLLLGTSQKLKNGLDNQFFKFRIDATVLLFNAGKIKYIIVSGDNSTKSYNEPLDMKIALLKRGIPESVIFLDYAGFRTYDSVIRCNLIFGQQKFLIISQKFHTQRAVFIARKLGLDAFGFNAKDVTSYITLATNVREFFARTKAYIDVIIKSEPKYIGQKIIIN
jgi:SanA protein